MGVIFISKLNRSIIFSICFMFIFNISSTVYASHKSDERIIGVGTLVSAGLAALAKAEVVAVLCAVGLRLGLDMNSTTESALDKFISENPDLINQENFGKSENGLIAVSKNVIDKFTTFLKDMFEQPNKPSLEYDSKYYRWDTLKSMVGYKIGPFPVDADLGEFVNGSSTYRYRTLKAGYTGVVRVSSNFAYIDYYNENGVLAENHHCLNRSAGGGTIAIPKGLKSFGTYTPQNSLKDDLGNLYTGSGDFILNPSWDVNANSDTGVLEGLPALPWEDKQFGSVGNVGVLNPDGTITDSPGIPDVENPDVPNEDVGEQTGILGILQKMLDWMLNFFDNLLQMLKDFISFLFVPTKAISTWEGFKDNFNNKFKFVGQLQSLNFKTNNNDRFKVTVPIAGHETVIAFPEVLENNVPLLRNLLKYSFYIITLFTVVSILRPKFTVNSD